MAGWKKRQKERLKNIFSSPYVKESEVGRACSRQQEKEIA
jgi:hypothetical protein